MKPNHTDKMRDRHTTQSVLAVVFILSWIAMRLHNPFHPVRYHIEAANYLFDLNDSDEYIDRNGNVTDNESEEILFLVKSSWWGLKDSAQEIVSFSAWSVQVLIDDQIESINVFETANLKDLFYDEPDTTSGVGGWDIRNKYDPP